MGSCIFSSSFSRGSTIACWMGLSWNCMLISLSHFDCFSMSSWYFCLISLNISNLSWSFFLGSLVNPFVFYYYYWEDDRDDEVGRYFCCLWGLIRKTSGSCLRILSQSSSWITTYFNYWVSFSCIVIGFCSDFLDFSFDFSLFSLVFSLDLSLFSLGFSGFLCDLSGFWSFLWCFLSPLSLFLSVYMCYCL